MPVVLADRFVPVPAGLRDLVSLWLPAHLDSGPAFGTAEPLVPAATCSAGPSRQQAWNGGPVEFDRVVQVKALRGVRPAGPPPRPSAEPVRVQRRASNTGIIMVVGQKVALGRIHKHQTVTVLVSDTTLAVKLDDGDVRVIRRTTNQSVPSIKGSAAARR